jgi:hypothetical protein
MNTVRMSLLTICAVVGASGYLLLRGAATDGAQPTQATRAPTANIAASNPAVSRGEEHAPDVRTLNTVAPAFEPPDTSELTQPSQTFNQVLDALNADMGPDGEYVDPQALADVLRSDPELSRLLNK